MISVPYNGSQKQLMLWCDENTIAGLYQVAWPISSMTLELVFVLSYHTNHTYTLTAK
jgi:hypothetical protein